MTPEQIALKRELDQTILHYVRELQSTAAIRAESIERYVRGQRHLRVDSAVLRDRIADLCDRGYLRMDSKWEAGEGNVAYFSVTGSGRAALDCEAPWDWETR